MKAVTITTLFAFICLSVAASFTPVQAASAGAMSGKYNYGSKGYRQAAKEKATGTKKMKKPHY
jgi:hypothetical protein